MSPAWLPVLLLLCPARAAVVAPGRTGCPEGQLLWPVDSTCHPPLTRYSLLVLVTAVHCRGPCGPGQVVKAHQQGPYCEHVSSWVEPGEESEPGEETELLVETGWPLPAEGEELGAEEAGCLEAGRVWWPGDGRCHALLTPGPCQPGHWLVLSDQATVNSHVGIIVPRLSV